MTHPPYTVDVIPVGPASQASRAKPDMRALRDACLAERAAVYMRWVAAGLLSLACAESLLQEDAVHAESEVSVQQLLGAVVDPVRRRA